MYKNILKKLNRFSYLILGLFVLLFFFQNCRMDFVATLSDRSTSSSSILPPSSTGIFPVASYSGNGGSYDGKLTFVALEPGFQCENQKSPKAILRFVDDQWYYTLNTEKQCGLIQNQAVQDVDYQEGQSFLTFKDLLFYQQASLNNNANFVTFAGQVKEFFVTSLADPNTSDVSLGDGVCSNSLGLCSLRAAIEEANAALSPGTKFYLIRVARGVYNMSATLIIRSPVFVGIFGEGPESTRVENISETGMIMVEIPYDNKAAEEERVTVSLQGLSFNRGHSAVDSLTATGILTYSPLHIKNCVFDDHTGNAPVILGGIISSSLLIEKTKIRGSQNTGIKLLTGASHITIDSSEFINNLGEGISFSSVSRNIRITRTTSAYNNTGIYLMNCYGQCLIENSTISGNTAYGLFANDAYYYSQLSDVVIVRNSTITSDSTASGISLRLSKKNSPSSQPPRYLRLENSIISRGSSSKPNCIFNAASLQAYQVLSVNSIADDASCNGEGNMTVVSNPMLGPLGDHSGFSLTHLLLPGSPAIDAGNDLLCPLSDQRGLMRSVSKTTSTQRCDVGAVEVQ